MVLSTGSTVPGLYSTACPACARDRDHARLSLSRPASHLEKCRSGQHACHPTHTYFTTAARSGGVTREKKEREHAHELELRRLSAAALASARASRTYACFPCPSHGARFSLPRPGRRRSPKRCGDHTLAHAHAAWTLGAKWCHGVAAKKSAFFAAQHSAAQHSTAQHSVRVRAGRLCRVSQQALTHAHGRRRDAASRLRFSAHGRCARGGGQPSFPGFPARGVFRLRQ